MSPVFADTFYWYGLANRRDQWHQAVLQAKTTVSDRRIVTTQEVLVEFASAMASNEFLRSAASTLIESILADSKYVVLPQTHSSFLAGLQLYRDRPDKQYSLVDCISMNACRAEGIHEVLTNDHHFEQEGFAILIRMT
jgi:predicted nucleic acid-binding protein